MKNEQFRSRINHIKCGGTGDCVSYRDGSIKEQLMNSLSLMVWTQLFTRSPVLLVSIAGMILSLSLWHRCPRACLMTLIACVVIVLQVVAQIFANPLVLHAREEMGWNAERIGIFLMVIGVVSNVMQAGALALLVSSGFIQQTGKKI